MPHVRRITATAARGDRQVLDTSTFQTGNDHRLWGIQAYKNIGWVYSAVSRIARDLSGLPFKVRTGPKPEDPEAPEDNPLSSLLSRPNLLMGYQEWMESQVTYLYTAGSAGSLLETLTPNLQGPVVEMWPLLPHRLDPVLTPSDVIKEWKYTTLGGIERRFPRESVAFFSLFDPENPIAFGLSPQSPIMLLLDTMYKATKWNARFFKKGARPSAIAETDEDLDDASFGRLLEQIVSQVEGEEKAWSVLLFDKGLKLKPWEASHKDLGFESLMRLIREEILAANTTPPAVAGDFKNANYAQVEMQDRTYWTNLQKPLVARVEGAVNRTIATRVAPSTDPRRPGLYFSIDLSGVQALQEDENAKVDRQTKLISFALRTPNEILAEEGRDTYEGGDTHYVMSSLMPVDQMLEPPEPPPPPIIMPNAGGGPGEPPPAPEGDEADNVEDADASQERAAASATQDRRAARGILDAEIVPLTERARRRKASWRGFDRRLRAAERELHSYWDSLFSDLAAYIVRRLTAHPPTPEVGTKAVRELLPLDASFYLPDPNELIAEAVDGHGRIYQAVVARFGEEAAKSIAQQVGKMVTFDDGAPELLGLVERDTERMVRVTDSLLDGLRATLSESGLGLDELTERIRDEVGTMRAERIARTEAISAANSGTLEGFRQAGVEKMEWLSSHDAFVRPSHARADGQVRAADDLFDLVDDQGRRCQLQFPGDPMGPASEVINCRCTLVPVVEGLSETGSSEEE